MRLPPLLASCGLFTVFLLGTARPLVAQARFTINARFKIEGGSLEGARMVVYRNGQKERTRATDLSKFSLDLELGQNYILSFEKPGYVTKKLSFDTRVPATAAGNTFVPFEFSVSLFKQYDDINIVVFNQPVGMIRYSAQTNDFDYDTDYTKSIQSQLKEVQEKVEKKQAEENRDQAVAEKKKAEEDKARAKAEADAAKADAAREKAAADEARREELRKATEIRKAEEAAKRAEAENKQAEARKVEVEKRAVPAKVDPAPPPARPVVPEAKPMPPPAPRVIETPPVRTASAAPVHEGADVRRTVPPIAGEEAPHSAVARAMSAQESQDAIADVSDGTERTEELQLEPGRVTTVIRLTRGAHITEYRRVVHKYGAVFYFRDGAAISKEIYEKEALAGR